jgi:methionyl-tRNA synthetase
MKRTPNDSAVKAAFDRFHATTSTSRKAAVAQLHTDMKRAGGPVPKDEEN